MQRKRLNPRDYLVFLLGRREYSEHELRQKLKLRECSEEQIEDAVAFVKELDLQSDERYAESRARMDGRRKGNRIIRQKLAHQGISSERIEQELQGLPSECERAIEVAKRFEGKSLDLKAKGKVWRFLTYRGFSGDAIRAALDHLEAPSA